MAGGGGGEGRGAAAAAEMMGRDATGDWRLGVNECDGWDPEEMGWDDMMGWDGGYASGKKRLKLCCTGFRTFVRVLLLLLLRGALCESRPGSEVLDVGYWISDIGYWIVQYSAHGYSMVWYSMV